MVNLFSAAASLTTTTSQKPLASEDQASLVKRKTTLRVVWVAVLSVVLQLPGASEPNAALGDGCVVVGSTVSFYNERFLSAGLSRVSTLHTANGTLQKGHEKQEVPVQVSTAPCTAS
uniref:Uncharacterized protein n=1 Tax=Eutreptiella gymnastica TaxID=73025 RepID=A0A7S1N574_9EUGL